jgi:hypothetical protein
LALLEKNAQSNAENSSNTGFYIPYKLSQKKAFSKKKLSTLFLSISFQKFNEKNKKPLKTKNSF